MFEFNRPNENRFEFVHSENANLPKEAFYRKSGSNYVSVLKDKLTGVHYILVGGDINSTITPLLGEDGKPFIDKG